MKKILPYLLAGALSFLPIKSQTVATISDREVNLKGNNLELKLDNYRDLVNSQGFLSPSFKNFGAYFLRNGLMNYNTGFQSEHIFSNYQSRKIRNVSSNNLFFHSVLDNAHVQDVGINFPVGNFEFDLEAANSNHEINSTIRKNFGEKGSNKIFSDVSQKTYLLGFGNNFMNINYIKNYFDSKTIISNNNSVKHESISDNHSNYLISLTPIDNVNISYGKELSAYLSTETSPINIIGMMDFENPVNNKLVIETSNLVQLEKKDFENKLVNNLRNVDRIYYFNSEKQRRFLNDGFFNSSFRLNLQQGHLPLIAIKFKYNDFMISTDTKNKFDVAYMKNNFIFGFKNKQFYFGYWK